jgi:dethiobiotin synthetase
MTEPRSRPLSGLFVTGTDTGVGKTFVAAAIARALRAEGRTVGVLKPAATGAIREGGRERWEDAEALIAATGCTPPLDRVAPIRFPAPLAPPVAARMLGVRLTFPAVRTGVAAALAWWAEQGADVMVVEGIGGLLCPLAEGATVADLALLLDYPLVIVARRGLGTLNHTLLTVEAARRRGMRIAGLVLNGAGPTTDPQAEAANPEELARRLPDVPLLAELEHQMASTPWPAGLDQLDWSGRAAPPRLPGGLIGLAGPSGDEEVP